MKRFGIALVSFGRGRLLAALLFALMGVLLALQEHTPLLRLRNLQFDQYQRQMPRTRDAEPAVVVGIDTASIERLGRWPWSRAVVADLVAKITDGQPLAVGFDILFSEPDHYSRGELQRQLPGIPAGTLAGLKDPDEKLADALFGEPTVLAAIGISNALPGARQPARNPLAQALAEAREHPVTRYPITLLSLPVFESHVAGMGLINAGADSATQSSEKGILRSVPAVALVGAPGDNNAGNNAGNSAGNSAKPMLSLPLEMVRIALQWKNNQVAPPVRLDTGVTGEGPITRLSIGDLGLPVQPNGEILLHFGRANSNYYVSAIDVLEGRIGAEVFANRFVLVGTNTPFEDRMITPRGENLPGIDAHVQVIESILAGTALRRPLAMEWIELAAFILCGLALLGAVPVLQPRFALATFGASAVLLIGGGYAAFALGRWLFDGLSVTVLLIPGFMALLSSTLIAADRERQKAEEDLRASREAAARMAGELDAARRIQLGLLPDPEAIFAGETRFALSALLEPAKEVGGDLYDCFMLDEKRLALAIGDVAGKGVPASLFMAIAKKLTGALTRRNADLGMAVQEIEQELNRENSECLFVTAIIAVLDVETGAFTYVCAGHDAPVLRRGGETTRLDMSESGPPLCMLGDFPYFAGQAQLEPGDLLVFFTDGVSEATDGTGLFGIDPVMAAVAAAPADEATRALLTGIHQAVRKFENGLPAADDLTLMVLRWNGAPGAQ